MQKAKEITEEKYLSQKKYFRSKRGKKALDRARKRYDEQDPDRRRKQKRDYMRRKRRGSV